VESKEMYTLEELYDKLEIPLTELSRRSHISDVTLAKIRDGSSARRSTVNTLLRAFSEIYGIKLSLDNVTGFIIRDKKALREQIEESNTRVIESVPNDLPPGTVKLADFCKAHNLAASTFSRWITEKGIKKGERIEVETREKASGMGVQHFLTPTQQEQALEILKRHGKLKTPEVEAQESI
jgi:hypothetical protein